MTPLRGNWHPTPELLAAYFDGECEGRDDLAPLKTQIEAWLDKHPQAQAELAENRRLLHAWQETTPPEPDPQEWAGVLDHLRTVQAAVPVASPPPAEPKLRPWRWAGVAVAAAVALFVFWPSSRQPAPAPSPVAKDAGEVLEVAAASEVSILRVEGADTHTLVVGVLPLQEAIELVSSHDVILTNIRPDTGDNMLPEIRMGGGSTPFIWARVDSEQDD